MNTNNISHATFLGTGLFVGVKNEQPFIYQGGFIRVRRDDLLVGPPESDASRQVWDAACRVLGTQLDAAFTNNNCEPIEGTPLELSGCQDTATGDWLLLWRIACIEHVTH